MAIGIAGLFLAALVGAVVVMVFMALKTWRNLQRQAKSAGYVSTGELLRAVPHSDQEKQVAVDLTLKGVVICLLGLLFAPLLLIGLLPLFCGTRKLILSSMGPPRFVR